MKNTIICADVRAGLRQIPDKFANCCVTSPPYYGLRNYGVPDVKWDAGSYVPIAGLPEVACGEWEGQLGHEPTIELFVLHIVQIFREVWRVLKDDGTLWLNFGDSYNGSGKSGFNPDYQSRHTVFGKKFDEAVHSIPVKLKNGLKPKDLLGIPWRIAFALQADGWYLRQDCIWHKPNPMPESVTDRCTKAHEYFFLLSKSPKYYFDYKAIRTKTNNVENWNGSSFDKGKTLEHHNNLHVDSKKPKFGGNKFPDAGSDGPYSGNEYDDNGYANKRSVWSVSTAVFKDAHFAVYPEKLIEPCVLAGCPSDGIVLDPFMGSGTTAVVARKQGRNYIGVELLQANVEMAENRIIKELGLWI